MRYSLPSLRRVSEVKFSVPKVKQAINRQQGLTLIEMLIAIAIFSILVFVVAPNMQTMLSKNTITARINELSSIARFARFTAIDTTSQVVVCPSPDSSNCGTDWDEPKIAFIDENNNQTLDDEESLLAYLESNNNKVFSTGPEDPLVFDEYGAANMIDSIVICPYDANTSHARSLNINLLGKARVSIDQDEDGVHEDINGAALSCG